MYAVECCNIQAVIKKTNYPICTPKENNYCNI